MLVATLLTVMVVTTLRGHLVQTTFPAALAPKMLSVLRIVVSASFFVHGTQKLFGWPESFAFPLNPLLYTAGVLEVVGGLLLAVGLFTRPVAFVLSGQMAVAYFIAYAGDGFFPALNGGEAAMLFSFVFLYIAAAGPGPWRLDALLDARPARAAATIVAVTIALAATAPASDAAAQSSLSLEDPTDVVTGLDVPWSIVFVGEEALVSQRNTAEIVAVRPGEPPRPVGTVPGVTARLDGGLLGLAVRAAGDGVDVYAYHSTDAGNRIVRMRYAGGSLGEPAVVLDGLPGGRGHNGGRIAFGPDGMLYAAVGDTQMPEKAQDPNFLAGKILRVTADGAVPADNPTAGSLVYSLGHRNPEGLAWDADGQLWATEFGEDAWDELNRIEPGRNYGWPIHEGRGGDPAYVDPVLQWGTQEMGPSGIASVAGTLFIAGLTGQRLWSVTFDASGSPVATPSFAATYGRIRDVAAGPDGTLWFVTNNTRRRRGPARAGDDRILAVRLAPAG